MVLQNLHMINHTTDKTFHRLVSLKFEYSAVPGVTLSVPNESRIIAPYNDVMPDFIQW